MGKVYLIGAGPGDPDLLTVKAARLLARATIVLHDSLVSREVLATDPPRSRNHRRRQARRPKAPNPGRNQPTTDLLRKPM